MFLIGFPLLLVPFAIYNIVAFLMPGVSWTGAVTTVHTVSGADWSMSADDMLVTLAILMLFGDVMKSTRIGIRAVVDHALSLILFLGMLVEFLLVNQCATATFFLLRVISFVDVFGRLRGNGALRLTRSHGRRQPVARFLKFTAPQ